MKTPLAAAGLDRDSQVLFSTRHPRPILRSIFTQCPRGKLGMQMCSFVFHSQPCAEPRVTSVCLSSFPAQDKVLSPGAEQRTSPSNTSCPLGHTQCHECRLNQRPEHPNDKKGFIRSISKPALSQLQHLNPEMSTCRAFTRSSNYADADLQE